MDPEVFTASLFKWDPRAMVSQPNRLLDAVAVPLQKPAFSNSGWPRELCGLKELFQGYGVRDYTAAKIAELGFTVNTLLNMKDEELDDMMNSLCQISRWDLIFGERYGVKSAVRAQRRQLDDEDLARRRQMVSGETVDAFSQEGLSEEQVQQHKEAAGSGGGGMWDMAAGDRKIQQRRRKGRKKVARGNEEMDHDDDNDNEEIEPKRQREHPFIVTEPGEVARGKKNGLDYLFHLYEQCRELLIQVQNIAKEHGHKCPTKVTNEVFRYARDVGASSINKPKMRLYVHCYALHCLDEQTSNALRIEFKERGVGIGAWTQACYKPLVAIAARQGWDIDAVFEGHPRLAIWYVPNKLRQLCHAERHAVTASSSVSVAPEHFTF
ncbi:hypothetical protein M5689_017563 [Euphorbia peplus]|nr:hypothetical protein M5689_017563 [Euphorbia peplus]